MTRLTGFPRFLMCAPAHFDVDYEINPWMKGNLGQVDHRLAATQFAGLRDALSDGAHGAELEWVEPVDGLPDMVFTANAGLLLGRSFVPSNFAHPQRQGEREPFARWFATRGWQVLDMPASLSFEGAGDALFDSASARLWMGHGFRTDRGAADWLAQALAPIEPGIEVVPLHLVDPRYYHLDTCFCPLADGGLLWNPSAFDDASRAAVMARVDASRRIEVDADDAARFACNAVSFGHTVVLGQVSDRLVAQLAARGLAAVRVPLGEFMKAGGSAKCLTLRLDAGDLAWRHQPQPLAA
ncbi:hypothetical protein BH09PSE6_BH09PSE6_25330 [soil metagenome]